MYLINQFWIFYITFNWAYVEVSHKSDTWLLKERKCVTLWQIAELHNYTEVLWNHIISLWATSEFPICLSNTLDKILYGLCDMTWIIFKAKIIISAACYSN